MITKEIQCVYCHNTGRTNEFDPVRASEGFSGWRSCKHCVIGKNRELNYNLDRLSRLSEEDPGGYK